MESCMPLNVSGIKKAKLKIPLSFKKAYPDSRVELVTPDNFESFLGVKDE